MMLAAQNGHEAVVVALHGLGADVNAKNNVSRVIALCLCVFFNRCLLVCWKELCICLFVVLGVFSDCPGSSWRGFIWRSPTCCVLCCLLR